MVNEEIIAQLQARLKNPEDAFIERKPEGVSYEDVCKTLVAFANSLAVGQQGVLFIGVADNGHPQGVQAPDKKQKWVRTLAEHCYPPVSCTSVVFEESGQAIIAVIVTASPHRPHFTGPAYIRQGSQSIVASPQLFEEMIDRRHSKCAAILAERDKGQAVILNRRWLDRIFSASNPPPHRDMLHECTVIECNAHYVRLQSVFSNEGWSEPLEKISLTYNEHEKKLQLTVNADD